jgi:hypothetical protein
LQGNARIDAMLPAICGCDRPPCNTVLLGMRTLDDVMAVFDWHEVHARFVAAEPPRAVAAALAAPATPDRVVRTLFRLRGLPAATTMEELFTLMGFETLARSADEVVVGASGRPWHPRGGIGPFASAEPGYVRIAADVCAVQVPGGAMLSTETRIAAVDDAARRAFGRYWRVVGPFSALIRKRWLAAAERTLQPG